MKNNLTKHAALLAALLLASACSNSSTDDLTEPIDPGEGAITYTEHVRPIIQNNCVMCHADPPINGAPMRLTTYEAVKNAVETRGLLDRIQRQQGEAGAMPLGGPRMPQQTIDVILQWNEDGLIEE